jgi:hypothetical protein
MESVLAAHPKKLICRIKIKKIKIALPGILPVFFI